jgi:hypothetical protein
MAEQNYKNHMQFVPLFHYFLAPLLLLVLIGAVVNFVRHIGDGHGRTEVSLILVMSFCLFLLAYLARTFALKVQDRAIRAEENLRHYVLTGKLLDSRLKVGQIIALRFASDAEFPALAQKAADTGMSNAEIKKSVRTWRPDFDRA